MIKVGFERFRFNDSYFLVWLHLEIILSIFVQEVIGDMHKIWQKNLGTDKKNVMQILSIIAHG